MQNWEVVIVLWFYTFVFANYQEEEEEGQVEWDGQQLHSKVFLATPQQLAQEREMYAFVYGWSFIMDSYVDSLKTRRSLFRFFVRSWVLLRRKLRNSLPKPILLKMTMRI